MKYTAGYLFKTSSREIHFIKINHGSPSNIYPKNFNRDALKAKKFESEDEALKALINMMPYFKSWRSCSWTPVLADEDGCLLKKYL